MPKKMRVYLSGQISNLTEEEYKANFERAGALCRAEDWEVVNPLEVEPCKDFMCGGSKPDNPSGQKLHAYSCYMRHDIKAELDCDAIVMLPNWKNSNGAKFELEVATMCGLWIFFIDHDYERIVQ